VIKYHKLPKGTKLWKLKVVERKGGIMRDFYDPKGGKKGKFALRENTYRRIWYLIADYRYFKCIQMGIKGAELLQRNSAAMDTYPFAVSQVTETPGEYREESDPKVKAQIQAAYRPENGMVDTEKIDKYIEAIETALEKVPEAYSEYIMEHIINRMRYKDMEGVSERTMKLWVQRFIWLVAQNLGEV